jgi:hypothetical protein
LCAALELLLREIDMAETRVKVLCEKHWERWKSDCSGFLKAVAADLGITLIGQANSLIDSMASVPWLPLESDAANAVRYAGPGYLVVGGLKATPNGHVVIVVPGSAIPYPTAYWGRLHAVGRKNATINWAWTHDDIAKVRYFARKV